MLIARIFRKMILGPIQSYSGRLVWSSQICILLMVPKTVLIFCRFLFGECWVSSSGPYAMLIHIFYRRNHQYEGPRVEWE